MICHGESGDQVLVYPGHSPGAGQSPRLGHPCHCLHVWCLSSAELVLALDDKCHAMDGNTSCHCLPLKLNVQ